MAGMIVPIFALAMFAQSSDAIPPNQRGSALYHNCKADVRMMDSPTGGENADMEPAEMCLEYMAGFLDAIQIDGSVCVNGASRGTVVRVYVAYMDNHPKLFDVERDLGLFAALLEAYPCPVKKPVG